MPTPYNGNAENISTDNAKSVSGCASVGGVIGITTSTAHNFSTNDFVQVASVGGVTAATGIWPILVTGPTTFNLIGSTFSGTYTSGGTATDLALSPAASLPVGGDPLTAASLQVPIQNCLDKIAFLGLLMPNLTAQRFSTSGTFKVPAGVTQLIALGFGGGGGGAGGNAGSSTSGAQDLGGPGGAGSQMGFRILSVASGDSVTVTIGAGGTAGVAGGNGGNGGNSSLTDGTANATWLGGLGGTCQSAPLTTTGVEYSPGAYGAPVASSQAPGVIVSATVPVLPGGEGAGGAAVLNWTTPVAAFAGCGNAMTTASTGGQGANAGALSDGNTAGGGGGGGGAGPMGGGGGGGGGGAEAGGTAGLSGNGGTGPTAGANGSNGTVGSTNAGGAGGAGAANTGAGGGGGGAGAGFPGGTGGAGGAGGSGLVVILCPSYGSAA
jgi:Ubiquitin-activating enzyme E1 FCCH domain